MIERRRTPDGGIFDVDHGPQLVRSHIPLSGRLAAPVSTVRPPRRPRPVTQDYLNAWKRMKRATDPEWHAREKEYERARRERRKVA